MGDYEKERPQKKIFPKGQQEKVLERAKEFVLKDLLPNDKINKIVIFGSLAKGTFGKYQKEWKHGYYSDIDAMVLVEDDFEPPGKWKIWANPPHFKVYVNGWLDEKYLVQYMVFKKSEYEKKEVKEYVNDWGLPLLMKKSKNKYIVIHEK